jgi:hypothetical protein
MKQWLFLLICILLLSVPVAVLADTPTPTPTRTPFPTWTPTATLIPLSPTATSKYQGFRLTPTPLHITPQATLQAQFDTSGSTGTFADTIINAYKAMNVSNVGDFVSFIVVALVIVVYLTRIQRRLTEHSD